MFIHTNKPLITSFYIKKVPIFCRISDASALICNFLRNGRVRVNSQAPELPQYSIYGKIFILLEELLTLSLDSRKTPRVANSDVMGA